MTPREEPQLLIMMMGTLGAGKSHFSRQLAEEIDAERVSVDAFRRQLFRTVEEWLHPGNYRKVYDLLDRRTEEALVTGRHVIRDARHDSRARRQAGGRIAARRGALAVAVWINTPPQVAVGRALNRPEGADTIKLDEEFVKDKAHRHAETVEPPEAGELAIEIDGRLPLEEQLEYFDNRLALILAGYQGQNSAGAD